MIRVNIDRALLSLLILSCVVSGMVFEGVFFVSLFAIIFRNRMAIATDKNYIWFIIIVALYIFTLLMTLFVFETATGWRPIGITKNLCGIALCVLMNDRLCKIKIEDIFIEFLIIFNILFCIFGLPSESDIEFIRLLDYPGQNTLGALNLIALPHILITYKRKMQFLRLSYFASFALFFLKNIGFTTIFSTSVVIAWILIDSFQEQALLKKYRNKYRLNILIPAFTAGFVLLFFVNMDFQKFYLDLLSKFDKDRYTILTQAIYRISNSTPIELIWGCGDNNYYMLTGRYIPAHNFIIEVITFDGLVGFGILIFETFIFIRFILLRIVDSGTKRTVLLSLILGYLYFLLHPVYTTSFLVKIYLIILNLRVCESTKKLSNFIVKGT